MSRGLRNCNPGNIEKSSDVYQGEIIPSQDKRFKQFKNMAYGYRAMFRILFTYTNRYRLTTLRQWITRWAPPEENDTEAYIKTVSSGANISPDSSIDTNNMMIMCKIVAEMSRVENGVPANMGEVESGYKLL